MSDNPSVGCSENTARELAQLVQLVCDVQARLDRLPREVAEAEAQLGSMPSVQIVEANEQLVLAAIRSLAEADTASPALEQLWRAARLDPVAGCPTAGLFRSAARTQSQRERR